MIFDFCIIKKKEISLLNIDQIQKHDYIVSTHTQMNNIFFNLINKIYTCTIFIFQKFKDKNLPIHSKISKITPNH